MFTGTHGFSQHPLYKVLSNIKTRCYSSKSKDYPNYGGRGIEVCNEWLNDYGAFIKWGIANGWKPGLEIDRIENEGNYEPSNCRFVTHKDNARNRRKTLFATYKGQTKPLSEWCEILDLPYFKTRERLVVYKWPAEKAFN